MNIENFRSIVIKYDFEKLNLKFINLLYTNSDAYLNITTIHSSKIFKPIDNSEIALTNFSKKKIQLLNKPSIIILKYWYTKKDYNKLH